MERELTGCYPIILDGSEAGTVTVSREGLFWRFEAKCQLREELIRLSVYGGGAEGYLGVLEPFDGELQLTKKLSRNALAGFPEAISYATRAGEAPPMDAYTEEAEVSPQEEEKADDCDCDLPPEDDKPPPAMHFLPPFSSVGGQWQHCPLPCSLFSDMAAKSLCGEIPGALLQRQAEGLTLAVPESAAAGFPKNEFLNFTERERIFGRDFRLARLKLK